MRVLGISNARRGPADEIDMIVQTNEGDIPFYYSPKDPAPMAKLIKEYLAAKPDLPIAAYQAPKAPAKPKVIKGGDND